MVGFGCQLVLLGGLAKALARFVEDARYAERSERSGQGLQRVTTSHNPRQTGRGPITEMDVVAPRHGMPSL